MVVVLFRVDPDCNIASIEQWAGHLLYYSWKLKEPRTFSLSSDRAAAATAKNHRGQYLGGAKNDTNTLSSSSSGRQLTELSRSFRCCPRQPNA